ncbi:hypothetical protein BKM63_07660 [Flavobacterium johnsoniae]|uniref:Uncharacterized protein n=1 Tax=Flavobacterium johnsoniae TaxID=986 RepID=A0A1J7BVN3_FLAJO|nr:hypothetical protein BKM63_07660 [Flavobacterium johnsoniae]
MLNDFYDSGKSETDEVISSTIKIIITLFGIVRSKFAVPKTNLQFFENKYMDWAYYNKLLKTDS